ncbi:MAG: NADH-quinone oxidoreductase subunit C [Chlorobi bacterium]|nr:NADH-quinone oxidoreductase subunit C [Chlorobiota bacterium]
MKELLQRLEYRFDVSDIVQKRENQTFLTIDKKHTISLITHLRDIENFSHFVLLTAVDWIEDNLFQLTYILHNPEVNIDIAIRTMISRDNPEMDSAHHLWEQVATYQRELKEMFGINFPGSPGVNDSFILEGWDDIPPYRRDFDTKKYTEETYFPRPGRQTNDPAEYMKNKLYPNG